MSRLLEELAAAEAREIVRRYRIEESEAREILRAGLETEPGLAERLAEAGSLEEARRWSLTRRGIKRGRRRIYYRLRRFQDRPGRTEELTDRLKEVLEAEEPDRVEELRRELIQGHASTRERLGRAEELREAILGAVPTPRRILDLGCGLHPLQWLGPGHPMASGDYHALDRDAPCIRAVSAYAGSVRPIRLEARRREIAELAPGGALEGIFDLGLLMKVVSQVRRQQRELLPILVGLPCRYLAVTEAAESLTRRRSIARRELRNLEEFARETRRPILARLEMAGEVGLVLGPGEES